MGSKCRNSYLLVLWFDLSIKIRECRNSRNTDMHPTYKQKLLCITHTNNEGSINIGLRVDTFCMTNINCGMTNINCRMRCGGTFPKQSTNIFSQDPSKNTCQIFYHTTSQLLKSARSIECVYYHIDDSKVERWQMKSPRRRTSRNTSDKYPNKNTSLGY